MTDQQPPLPDLPPNASATQTKGTTASQSTPSEGTIPANGGRQAFRDIRRQLSETELASPGVNKLLLDELEQTEIRCEVLNGYVERFHDADKRAAILEEKNKVVVATEIIFGVGVGVGCSIMCVAPSLWSQQPLGYLAIFFGAILVIGASYSRMVKR